MGKLYAVRLAGGSLSTYGTRAEAIQRAEAALEDGSEGWPDGIEDVAVFEMKPLRVTREKPGRKVRIDCGKCSGEGCYRCDHTGFVDQHGEAWVGDPDWIYVTNYRLVKPRMRRRQTP